MCGNDCKHTACMHQKAASDRTSQIRETCKCVGDGGASRVSLQHRVVGSDRVDHCLLGGKGLSVVSVFWRCVAFLLPITRRSGPATETPPDLAMSPRRNMATSQARTPNRTRRETQCMFATKAEVPHTTSTSRTNDAFRTAGCKRTSTQRAGSQTSGRCRLKSWRGLRPERAGPPVPWRDPMRVEPPMYLDDASSSSQERGEHEHGHDGAQQLPIP